MKRKITAVIAMALTTIMVFTGCQMASEALSEALIESKSTEINEGAVEALISTDESETTTIEVTADISDSNTDSGSSEDVEETSDNEDGTEDSSGNELFTERDLEQTVDGKETSALTLESGSDVTITEEGIYMLSGAYEEVTVIVDADDEAKVQLVLDGLTVTNTDSPVIYVKSGDKVYVTTTDSDNEMTVTGYFTADGDVNTDAVIYSKSDLVLNGLGTLVVWSEKGNGITSKDDLKVTGGSYEVTAAEDGFEANDSIRINDGNFTVAAGKDAFHSEHEEDLTLGYIYINGGDFNIAAGDDAIRATSILQINDGNINIETCTEGIEATYVQINGGDITLYATDDGINATAKSNYDVVIEVNGGNIDVTMASGDTDGFDANGSIVINDGVINITTNGMASFDADMSAVINGGEVYVNGEQITTISTEMGGGRMGGGKMGGQRPTRP